MALYRALSNLHDNTVELGAGGVPADAVPPSVQAHLPLLLHGALEGQVVSLAVQVQSSTYVHYTQVTGVSKNCTCCTRRFCKITLVLCKVCTTIKTRIIIE